MSVWRGRAAKNSTSTNAAPRMDARSSDCSGPRPSSPRAARPSPRIAGKNRIEGQLGGDPDDGPARRAASHRAGCWRAHPGVGLAGAPLHHRYFTCLGSSFSRFAVGRARAPGATPSMTRDLRRSASHATPRRAAVHTSRRRAARSAQRAVGAARAARAVLARRSKESHCGESKPCNRSARRHGVGGGGRAPDGMSSHGRGWPTPPHRAPAAPPPQARRRSPLTALTADGSGGGRSGPSAARPRPSRARAVSSGRRACRRREPPSA